MNLHPIFCDGMILQARKPIYVAGKDYGQVAVSFLGKTKTLTVDGEWAVTFAEADYGGPYTLTVTVNEETRVIRDVMLGDVYLCAGQSNMQFTVEAEEIERPTTDNPLLRTFVAKRPEAYTGIQTEDGWVRCTPETVADWSAIGYHIAEIMFRKTGHAIGIIGCFQGASAIQPWIAPSYLTPEVDVPMAERHADWRNEIYSQWNRESYLYENTFAPLTPYSVADVIWYQGESDTTAAEARVYAQLLEKLADCWREALRDARLRFIVIEICDYDPRDDEGWHAVQQAQRDAAKQVPYLVTIPSSDVCSHEGIHPPVKTALAARICTLL